MSVPPTLYVLNAAAVTKPHAIDHLAADMRGYHVDVSIISETHLKQAHDSNAFGMDGYIMYRHVLHDVILHHVQQSPEFITLEAC